MNPLSVGRAFISANSLTAAASALAIALRYTATRRQFTGPK
jgi:alkylation response protein AidB-like acyl-CoA dehydrogenase